MVNLCRMNHSRNRTPGSFSASLIVVRLKGCATALFLNLGTGPAKFGENVRIFSEGVAEVIFVSLFLNVELSHPAVQNFQSIGFHAFT
jgi:hypothetical protein